MFEITSREPILAVTLFNSQGIKASWQVAEMQKKLGDP